MTTLLTPPSSTRDGPAEIQVGPGRHFFTSERIAAFVATLAIIVNLTLRAFSPPQWILDLPLILALLIGGSPLIFRLAKRLLKAQFGSDLLAGISIVTAAILGQYLAGTLIVLMLSGGEILEAYAMRTASGALRALARRMPTIAHRWDNERLTDAPATSLQPTNSILVLPHEVCPADGVVTEGHGAMDESFLTGEPYGIAKAPGSEVLSGSLNGPAALTVRVVRTPADSRYARIVNVMREAEQGRIRLRRIGDTIGAWLTPIMVAIALLAWLITGNPLRFLAVLVVATPCPLIIAIPVAIIGAISLAARRGIVIRDAAILEQLETCQTVIFDKTGTLTVGRPKLAEILPAEGFTENDLLQLTASLEEYSRHPLAPAILEAARERKLPSLGATDLHEPPGQGLRARVANRMVTLTGRKHLPADLKEKLPPVVGGLECIALVDGRYAGTLRLRDEPRSDLRAFIRHLQPKHGIRKTVLLTGDRAEEANRIATHAGIQQVLADQSPEDKLAFVRAETAKGPTLFVGDGVNDAPALVAATAGVALGAGTDVAAAAAGAVILEPSLRKLDELAHIARRLRQIVLQSAIGGMALSLIAVGFAAAGYLTPVAGAVVQELIDLAAILNAMRAAIAPRSISDI